MWKKTLTTTGRPFPTRPYSISRRLRLRDITGARKECTLAAIVHNCRKLVGLIGVSPTGVSTAVNGQNVRILHQNLAIDIAGLSWCIIPVQNIPSFTAGVLLLADESKWQRLGHPA